MSELIYRARPSQEFLREYADMVEQTAAFMASKSSETTVTGIVELLGLSDVPWERSYGFYGWQYRERHSLIFYTFGGVQTKD